MRQNSDFHKDGMITYKYLPLSATEFYMNLIGTVNASGNIFYQKGLSFVSSSENALKLEVGTEEY